MDGHSDEVTGAMTGYWGDNFLDALLSGETIVVFDQRIHNLATRVKEAASNWAGYKIAKVRKTRE